MFLTEDVLSAAMASDTVTQRPLNRADEVQDVSCVCVSEGKLPISIPNIPIESRHLITFPKQTHDHVHAFFLQRSLQFPRSRLSNLRCLFQVYLTNHPPQLLAAIQDLIIPFIRAADQDALTKPTGHGLQVAGGGPRTVLVEHHAPKKLESILAKELEIDHDSGKEKDEVEGQGSGKEGLVKLVSSILKYSVNTWDQGFLDKLYASTNAVGVVSELLLAVLNTNVRAYPYSPSSV